MHLLNIQSYLRSTMSQERLNGLTILSIEQNLLKNIENKSLISNFVTEAICRVIFQYIYIYIYFK